MSSSPLLIERSLPISPNARPPTTPNPPGALAPTAQAHPAPLDIKKEQTNQKQGVIGKKPPSQLRRFKKVARKLSFADIPWSLRYLLDRADRPHNEELRNLAQFVRRTLETKPKSATHWNTRTMAKDAGVSHQTISRIWHAFGIQPHRQETFTLSTDPIFAAKVRDVVGLYQRPPQNAVVFCVDEKSRIQALERSQPILPVNLGRVECHRREAAWGIAANLFTSWAR